MIARTFSCVIFYFSVSVFCLQKQGWKQTSAASTFRVGLELFLYDGLPVLPVRRTSGIGVDKARVLLIPFEVAAVCGIHTVQSPPRPLR